MLRHALLATSVLLLGALPAHAAITGLDFPEITQSGGCSLGGGDAYGGTLAGELCYTTPSSAGPGSLSLAATFVKGTRTLEIDAFAFVTLSKQIGTPLVAYDFELMVTENGTSYLVPLDATRSELMPVEDIFSLVDDFTELAVTSGVRFNPTKAQRLNGAVFPVVSNLRVGVPFAVQFGNGADAFTGDLTLEATTAGERVTLRGAWSDAVVRGLVAERVSGSNGSEDDYILKVTAGGGDTLSSFAPWISVTGKSDADNLQANVALRGDTRDEAATRFVRWALARGLVMTQAP